MVIIQNNQVFSTENKYIHRIDSNVYFKKGTILISDSINDYEEVDEIPVYTEKEYNSMVSELIHERYDIDDEISLINNMQEEEPTEEHRKEYEEYQAYRAKCKVLAKEKLIHDKEVNTDIND